MTCMTTKKKPVKKQKRLSLKVLRELYWRYDKVVGTLDADVMGFIDFIEQSITTKGSKK